MIEGLLPNLSALSVRPGAGAVAATGACACSAVGGRARPARACGHLCV